MIEYFTDVAKECIDIEKRITVALVKIISPNQKYSPFH